MQITFSKSLTTAVDPSQRVLEAAAMFGLGVDEAHRLDIVPPTTLTLPQPGVIFITGPSGSGKSTVLSLIAEQCRRHECRLIDFDQLPPLAEKPLVDVFDLPLDRAASLLALAGLGDAFVMLRTPSQLSDGQRYRLRLAQALHLAHDQGCVVIADEFGATLDRLTAKIIAMNVRKWVNRSRCTFICATTHDDLLEPLQPDVLLYKGLGSEIQIHEPPRCKRHEDQGENANDDPTSEPDQTREHGQKHGNDQNRNQKHDHDQNHDHDRRAPILQDLLKSSSRAIASLASVDGRGQCECGLVCQSGNHATVADHVCSSATRHIAPQPLSVTTTRCHAEAALKLQPGTLADYHSLSSYHYKGAKPGAVTSVLRLVHDASTVVGRYLNRKHECTVIGVLVRSLPHLACSLRDEATGQRYRGLQSSHTAAILNREVRTISRVVIHPQWRGLGLAVMLVKHALANAEPGVIYTEALAAMGHVHPFFERAGMTRYERPPRPAHARLMDVLDHLGLAPAMLASPMLVRRHFASCDERWQLFLRELRIWHRRGARRSRNRHQPTIDDMLMAARDQLITLPVYYLYRHGHIDAASSQAHASAPSEAT